MSWKHPKPEVNRLAKALQPHAIRDIRTVAKMMGLSHGAIWYLEHSALEKILKAFRKENAQ